MARGGRFPRKSFPWWEEYFQARGEDFQGGGINGTPVFVYTWVTGQLCSPFKFSQISVLNCLFLTIKNNIFKCAIYTYFPKLLLLLYIFFMCFTIKSFDNSVTCLLQANCNNHSYTCIWPILFDFYESCKRRV